MPGADSRSDSDEYFMLWALIAQTKDAILRARELEYARYGISNERRAVLYIIHDKDGCATPVEIARDLFRELHSVTELLARMEKDGLVTRHKGSGRSKVEVRLTQEGRDVFHQSLHNDTDRKIFSTLTRKQRERLAQYLWKLRNRTLEHLGIPEWQLDFPRDVGAAPAGAETGEAADAPPSAVAGAAAPAAAESDGR